MSAAACCLLVLVGVGPKAVKGKDARCARLCARGDVQRPLWRQQLNLDDVRVSCQGSLDATALSAACLCWQYTALGCQKKGRTLCQQWSQECAASLGAPAAPPG